MKPICFPMNDYRGYPIPQLVRLLADDLNNAGAWDEFFQRFDRAIHRMVTAALRKILGPCAVREAGDLAQEVYCRLIEHEGRALRNFRGTTENDFYAYLSKICYHLAQDYCRATFTNTVPLVDQSTFPEDDGQEKGFQPVADAEQERTLQERELREQIEAGLGQSNSLDTQRDRLVFILRYYHGYSAKEVAGALRIAPSHVNTIYHRSCKKLVIHLSKSLQRVPSARASRRDFISTMRLQPAAAGHP